MEKQIKYELVHTDTIQLDGRTLYRIRAIRDFGYDREIKKGDLGGYVESEYNLSHDRDCWVDDNAIVYEGGRVQDNAVVCEEAVVRGGSDIRDFAIVSGASRISGDTTIGGCAEISGTAKISGGIWISGNANIQGIAAVDSYKDILYFSGFENRGSTPTFYRGADGNVYVTTGSDDELRFDAVIDATDIFDPWYFKMDAKEMRAIISLVEVHFDISAAIGSIEGVADKEILVAETPINWEQRRYEIAKDAMCAFLRQLKLDRGNLQYPLNEEIQTLTEKATLYADALIVKLKGEQNGAKVLRNNESI